MLPKLPAPERIAIGQGSLQLTSPSCR
jgi:hypothetical protein